MTGQEGVSPLNNLRPTKEAVNDLARYADEAGTRVLNKGGRIQNLHIAMIYLSAGVALIAAVLAAFLDADTYKPIAAALSAFAALLSFVASRETPQRAADNFDIGNAWHVLRDNVKHLAGQLHNPNLSDKDAAAVFRTFEGRRTQLTNEELGPLRGRPAELTLPTELRVLDDVR
jgi:hypothetical protein